MYMEGSNSGPPPPPAPAKPPVTADGGLDFQAMEPDQLRSFLVANEVTFHPQSGHKKLVEKAVAFEAEQAKKKKPAPTPDEAV